MSIVDTAASRLDAALQRLESAVNGLNERAGDPVIMRRQLSAMVHDRDQLAQRLDTALSRERDLQLLADEASEALGSAIAEVRAVLARDEANE